MLFITPYVRMSIPMTVPSESSEYLKHIVAPLKETLSRTMTLPLLHLNTKHLNARERDTFDVLVNVNFNSATTDPMAKGVVTLYVENWKGLLITERDPHAIHLAEWVFKQGGWQSVDMKRFNSNTGYGRRWTSTYSRFSTNASTLQTTNNTPGPARSYYTMTKFCQAQTVPGTTSQRLSYKFTVRLPSSV